MPLRGGMTSSSSHESNTGGDGPTPVYSTTSYVPAVLANPLSVRAAVLRKPELLEELAPELVEEGDILFDVLANPLYHPSTIVVKNNSLPPTQRRSEAAGLSVQGVGSVLSLPSSVGKYFVGQLFRAFLSFHNAATYPLSSLLFNIECFHPKLQRTTLVSYELSRLDGKGNAAFTVEFVLQEPGQHTLSVIVTYLDIVNETKRLTWSSSFYVDRAITEVHQSLNIIPVMTRCRNDQPICLNAVSSPTFQEAISNIVLPKKKYVLSIGLQNTSSVSLVIVSVKLHTKEAFECLSPQRSSLKLNPQLPPWWPSNVKKPEEDTGAPCIRDTSACTGALEDIHLHPGDQRCYSFEFIMRSDKLCSLASCQSTSIASSTVASSSLLDIGYVEWEWRRSNGDGGTDRSSLVRFGDFPKRTMLELFVINVRPETPTAGRPLTLECVAINYDAESRIDLALRVRPEMLTPAILYAGPLVCPLGTIEPLGTLTFCVSLVPWQPGWIVLQGGLELCDARTPATLLWPLKPAAAQPPPHSPSTTSSVVVTDTPRPPYPPVLCELLVC